jgi:DNA-directed RNA polymerase subunit RPC12/RpoP
MSPAVECSFQLNMKVEEAYSLIWQTLIDLKPDLKLIKEIPAPSNNLPRKPSYVVLEYSLGLLRFNKKQVELSFVDRQSRTTVSLKWNYPSYERERKTHDGLTGALWDRKARSIERATVEMVEELKSRVGATEITQDQQVVVKEIIKESQVIVKVRCPYCANLYDEALDRCPHCGGKR